MARYLVFTLAVAAILVLAYIAVFLFVPAPIGAEYWVRNMIIVKTRLAQSLPSPRLIFFGGSATLFGVDAKQIERETGMPAMNMGVNVGLSLDRELALAAHTTRSGDLLILMPEPMRYYCHQGNLNAWQFRNTLAWDREYFLRLPLIERIEAVFSGGTPRLAGEIVFNAIGARFVSGWAAPRREAMASSDTIWARYRAGTGRTHDFVYSAYNLDDRGDIEMNAGGDVRGFGTPTDVPGAICPAIRTRLAQFVADMKARGVRVIFAHTPYLVDSAPKPGWQAAETMFALDIAAISGDLLDPREELFLPRADFFNTQLHLNDVGRRERTMRLIARLRERGIVPPARP